VLLPCYNGERHLSSGLDSLLAQTYVDFEIIAIDDGSEDSTSKILADYAARDPRIRASRNETNLGLVRTLNRGIELSRGEYIARMDADDEAEPTRLQTQVGFLDTHSTVDLVSSSVTLIDIAGRVIGERLVWVTGPTACRYVTAFATPVVHAAMMARRDCIESFGYSLDAKALHAEDYELWGRLVAAGRQLANIPESLYRIRLSSHSVSVRNERLQVQNFITCVQDSLRQLAGEDPPRETVEVLANRIAFSRRDVPLDDALQLLERLTDRAISEAPTQNDRREILDAAVIQRLDILLQCVLKGRWTLRAKATPRVLSVGLRALPRRTPRRFLLAKLREATARILRDPRGTR
jgi:glycosyltransferase involved in cell wall biosynthesis